MLRQVLNMFAIGTAFLDTVTRYCAAVLFCNVLHHNLSVMTWHARGTMELNHTNHIDIHCYHIIINSPCLWPKTSMTESMGPGKGDAEEW